MINKNSNNNPSNIDEFKTNFSYRNGNTIVTIARINSNQEALSSFTAINHPNSSNFSLALITKQNPKDKLNISKIAIRQTENWFKQLDKDLYNDPEKLQKNWQEQLKNISSHIKNLQRIHHQSLDWGCLYTALITTKDYIVTMHIGDAAIYTYDINDQVQKITKKTPLLEIKTSSIGNSLNPEYIQSDIISRQTIDTTFLANNALNSSKKAKEIIIIGNIGKQYQKQLDDSKTLKRKKNL